MKTTEEKRAQCNRIIALICANDKTDWVDRLLRFTQFLLKHHTDLSTNK